MQAYAAENLSSRSGLCFCSAWLDTNLCTAAGWDGALSWGRDIVREVHPLVASHTIVCGAVTALLLNIAVCCVISAETQRGKTCVACNSCTELIFISLYVMAWLICVCLPFESRRLSSDLL